MSTIYIPHRCIERGPQEKRASIAETIEAELHEVTKRGLLMITRAGPSYAGGRRRLRRVPRFVRGRPN